MMPEASLTYFTCTLGQAAEQNKIKSRDVETVTQFIDLQARVHPTSPAVGFPVPASKNDEKWDCNVFCGFSFLF